MIEEKIIEILKDKEATYFERAEKRIEDRFWEFGLLSPETKERK